MKRSQLFLIEKHAQLLVIIFVFGSSLATFSQIPNVRITTNGNDQNEFMLAINPTDINKLD